MPEATTAAPAATPTSAPTAPAPSAPAAPATPAAAAKRSTADLIAAATKALNGETATPAPAAPAADSPLPSTPEAPATKAVLAQEETASELLRLKGELADGRKALDAERARWQAEQATKLQQAEAAVKTMQAFERDPAGFIEAYKQAGGKRTPEEIARDIYLASVDLESLTPEQRGPILAERRQRALEREHEQLKAQLAQSEQQRQMAEVHQRLAAYRSELAAGLAALTDATPLVKSLSAKRPDLAVTLMEEVAGRLALEQPHLGRQSTAQLAERIEQSLASELDPFSEYFEKKYKPAAPAAPLPSAAPAPSTPPARASLSSAITDETPVTRRPTTEAERIAAATRALIGQHS